MNTIANKKEALPAGLVDTNVEFFVHKNEVFCLYNGKTYSFDEIPAHILEIIRKDMNANKAALRALDSWNIFNLNERIKQYIACRFGAFDNTPDIGPDGRVSKTEYVDCGRRGQCPWEGRLCSSIVVAGGVLKKEEIQVLRLMGAEKVDKEIAHELNLTYDRVCYVKKQIKLKTGVDGKSGLAVLAHKLNLI